VWVSDSKLFARGIHPEMWTLQIGFAMIQQHFHISFSEIENSPDWEFISLKEIPCRLGIPLWSIILWSTKNFFDENIFTQNHTKTGNQSRIPENCIFKKLFYILFHV